LEFDGKFREFGDSLSKELSGKGMRAERIAEKSKACSHFWGIVPGVLSLLKVAAKTVKSQMLRGARALSVRQSYAKCPN
jgi:hypothetical protein